MLGVYTMCNIQFEHMRMIWEKWDNILYTNTFCGYISILSPFSNECFSGHSILYIIYYILYIIYYILYISVVTRRTHIAGYWYARVWVGGMVGSGPGARSMLV